MEFVVSCVDDVLKVTLVGQEMEAFKRTSLWKMKLAKLKVLSSEIDGQSIVFPSSLTRLEREEIVSALSAAKERGYQITLSPSYKSIKDENDSKIREKSRVGLAIKTHDESVVPQFKVFREVIDSVMARPLYDMQAWDAFFMCTIGKSANFSVPGSGKTASSLGVFAYLFAKGLAKRVIVISPKNAFGSWRDEWNSCFGDNLSCRSLCFHDEKWSGTTSADKKRELSLNSGRYNLILLNYESTKNYEAELRSLISADTLLVFDEIHKIKRIGGVRATSAIEASKDAQFVIALTGTPIPNSYCDIYNMLNILYPDDYDLFFGFQPDMLKDPSYDDVQQINQSIQPFFCRTNKRSLHVPEASPDEMYFTDSSCAENRLLLQLMNAYKNDRLALIIRILQMESDPEMLLTALDATEFDGLIDETPYEGSVEPCDKDSVIDVMSCRPTTKFRACVDLVASLASEGKSVVVWCFFRRSMDNLVNALSDMGYTAVQIHGGVGQDERIQILNKFKDKQIQILITNPQTLAESVSLHSVCHDAVYFEYSYNLVHLLQSKDRIHRLGLPDGQYTQYHFLGVNYDVKGDTWSLDKRIYERLSEKEETMLNAIDRGVLEAGSTDEHDLDVVFSGLFD